MSFLKDAVANEAGAVVSGSLVVDQGSDKQSSPLAGIVLRISLDEQRFETTTRADGTFVLTGVPPGSLSIDPILPDPLVLPPQQSGAQVRGGCLTLHLRASYNGRVRGRVLLDNGERFRGFVDIIPDGHSRRAPTSRVLTSDRGEFSFSAVPPGAYLVGINLQRQPSSGSPFQPTYFPGTTDRSQAIPVVVGLGTEHADLEWVVNSRLREGTIAVSFNTNGQLQKEMGVCVTMFDADNRDNGGVGYERSSADPVVVRVVEGVKYRLVAWARTPSGSAESEIFDVIGSPGHRAITLQLASVSERLTGMRCVSSHSDKPFSP